MVRALQMIVLLTLVYDNVPRNVYVFMKQCLGVAGMDILEGETLIDNNFSFKDTSPLNDKFEMFGMDNKNFLLNSGSYFLIQIIMLAIYLAR